MSTPAWIWAATFAAITAVLFLDLFVFHRGAGDVDPREAAVWSAVWVGAACTFGAIVWAWRGGDAAVQYFAGYTLEKALSVDNLFVFSVLLAAFSVPTRLQHRLLNWGVVGALVFRAVLITAGVALISRVHLALVVLGGLLVVAAVQLLRTGDAEAAAPEGNRAVRLVRRWLPMTAGYSGARFTVRERGRLLATPLLAALVAIELTDVVFALDSIPAVLGVTTDTFLVVTSNAFAVLGLRSMFFVLHGLAGRLRFLRPGLGVILAFVGAKMVVSEVVEVPVAVSLGVIAVVMATVVAASWVADRRDTSPST